MADSAEALNERGRELSAAGDSEGALAAYRAAARAAPSWSVPWYNLGLEHKYRAEWQQSADCNREAVLRDASEVDAWWNLGIAATALGAWRQARAAWERCGVTVPPGDGPIHGDYGLTPIQLAPATRGEVVWCDRIDPARAIVRNIPLPESGRFYADLLLHYRAANGTRMLQGREVPVFDELQRLQRSDFRTCVLARVDRRPACDARRRGVRDPRRGRGLLAIHRLPVPELLGRPGARSSRRRAPARQA